MKKRPLTIVACTICVLSVVAGLCLAYARFIEPRWLAVRTVSLSDSPIVTLIHISDIHYKGDREYLSGVVATINAADADFVCFTGDLIEDKAYLSECMAILSGINKPFYGVSGNHDEWAQVQKTDVADTFAATGGQWLTGNDVAIYSDTVAMVGEPDASRARMLGGASPDAKKILLYHYPDIVDRLPEDAYDLILAGHTHGGQVRIPLVRNPVLPERDREYSLGLFHTDAGPLYVSAGIGTYYWPIRFRCRPEVTIIRL
jgi:predicted MPP superfamily phosphohydrolase